MKTYRYTMKSTGDSSAKYGSCEVCGKPASEVFHLMEKKSFIFDGRVEWTGAGCRANTFGHEGCLNSLKRNAEAA